MQLATISQPIDTIRYPSLTSHYLSLTCRYSSLLLATLQWPKSPGPPSMCLDPDRDDHMILPFPHSATWPLVHSLMAALPFVVVPFVLPWSLVHIYSPPVVASFPQSIPFPSAPSP